MSHLSHYARTDDARLAWTGESQQAYELRMLPKPRLRFWDRVWVWLHTPLW